MKIKEIADYGCDFSAGEVVGLSLLMETGERYSAYTTIGLAKSFHTWFEEGLDITDRDIQILRQNSSVEQWVWARPASDGTRGNHEQ